MSFNSEARRVRDTSLPHAKRVSSLRRCVQEYQPLGWHATLSFLQHVAGPFQHDEDALLRALEILDRSRLARWAAHREYAERRRREKGAGLRVPRRGDPDPVTLHFWFGDGARAGSMHALWHEARPGGLVHVLRVSSAPGAREVTAAVDACLAAGGELSEADRRWLASLLPDLYIRTSREASDRDLKDFYAAWVMLTVVRLITTAGVRA